MIALVQTVAVFGIHLSGNVGQLVLVAHVLEYNQVLSIKRHVSAEATLMKHVPHDEHNTNVLVMIALGKQTPQSFE
jgi:hypothetical protein